LQTVPAGALERKRLAKCQLELLDELEKNLLKHLLVTDTMNEAHAIAYMHSIGCTEVKEFLAPITQKPNFITKNFAGYYEISPAFREALEELIGSS